MVRTERQQMTSAASVGLTDRFHTKRSHSALQRGDGLEAPWHSFSQHRMLNGSNIIYFWWKLGSIGSLYHYLCAYDLTQILALSQFMWDH